ncbi:hypothetical protein BGZ95_008708 [Linnemannia exigua]|uniref:tRNA:m(4)X modification enzyme TRM13 n=1 Tax=Linnemannia exigua TaxID=604196 RepID=A0AAD4DE66_9FUNG|nr:hypothetical protein BGZ95_008708 [Linnemannia exigua]
MLQQHPVICQHSIWGSKQQRYRHCKLPAKLSQSLLDQLKQLELQCFPPATAATEEHHAAQVTEYLLLRKTILQPSLDAHKILCGHHQKEALAAQLKQDEISKAKAEGTYRDPEELKRLAKEQPVNPKDIPSELLDAVERVFSEATSSEWVRRVLDQADGPEEWKIGSRSGEEGEHVGGTVGTEEGKEFPCHESYERLFSEAGAKKKRHLAQESQLIQSMSTLGLLRPVLEQKQEQEQEQEQGQEATRVRRRPVFVEFGAGTGGLSRHLQLVLETIVAPTAASSSSAKTAATESTLEEDRQLQSTSTTTPTTTTEPFNFVLLDRQKFRSRNQVDYMIRTQPRPIKPRVLRITKDVRELTLENLQLIHEVEPGVAWPDWTEGGGGEIKPKEESTRVGTHYLCISKHFCGPATDLALSWMRDQRVLQEKRKKEAEGGEGGEPQDLYSICFATCCHGICEPSLVVAKAYLLELLNSSSSSSSFCGSIKKRKRAESEELDVKMMEKTDSNTNETTTVEHPSSPALVSEEQLEAWVPWIIKLTGWATLGKEEESSLVARPGKDASLAEEEVMTRNQRRVLGKRCKKLLDMARCMYLMRECGFREAKSIEYTTESVESGAIVGTM